MEMVKELEISDWDPFDIANMINREISALLPHRWKNDCSDSFHTFSYQDDDFDESRLHFRSISSSSSLHESIPDFVSKSEEISHGYYLLHGMSFFSQFPSFFFTALYNGCEMHYTILVVCATTLRPYL
jgi:hypothetical protein